MTIMKKCVAVFNNRSGYRQRSQAAADTLKQYMNRAGIVHHDLHIPNDDLAEGLRRGLPQAEALVLCGGDGTVNSTVNLLAAMLATEAPSDISSPASSSSSFSSSCGSTLHNIPLLLVPTGAHNSIATSLGVTSAQRAISSLVIGRTVRVPLWAVRLHPPGEETRSASSLTAGAKKCIPVRYMCSYLALGTYAAAVERQGRWKAAQDDFVSVPSLFSSYTAASLFCTLEHAAPCSAVSWALSDSLTDTRHRALPSAPLGPPLRLCVASQMPQLQAGYSLTPTATFHRHELTVTTATEAATRLRLWHLLWREAREGYILNEDGVTMRSGVRELRLEVSADAGRRSASAEAETTLLVLDGESVQVPSGSAVTVTPTPLTVQFIVS